MVTVFGTSPDSYAEKSGIKVGDILHTVGGNEIHDVIDYRFYLTEKVIELKLSRDGVFYKVKITKKMYDDIGLHFDTYLMDKKHSCQNKCIFCFIDQLPCGMRETIYFKDDDSRLSFLMGNYITMTNLLESDIDRIIKMKISPINISVHTTNPSLRIKMMGNKNAGKVLSYIDRLHNTGITLNCQIVLCKGINDGEELDRSMRDLAKYYPSVSSVSIVPVGITKYRENLYPLTPYNADECKEIINKVSDFGDTCLEKYGSRIFFCADEFYIKSGTRMPGESFYEGFPQIENGVGMIADSDAEIDYQLSLAEIQKINPKRVFSIATGVAAYDFMKYEAKKIMEKLPNTQINVYKIENEFFGQHITVVGLLTATDILKQLKDKNLGEVLFLSDAMLRAERDRFLDDVTIEEFVHGLGASVKFVASDCSDLLSLLTEAN